MNRLEKGPPPFQAHCWCAMKNQVVVVCVFTECGLVGESDSDK